MRFEESSAFGICCYPLASRKSRWAFTQPANGFDFVRKIITEDRIPEAVIQVLCQSREELIVRSVDAIAGAKRHLPPL